MNSQISILENFKNALTVFQTLSFTSAILSIIEIGIIAVFVYYFLMWVRDTHAWVLLRGLAVILLFIFIAWILNFEVILYFFWRLASVAIIAIIVIFQNDLRTGLEHLGRQSFFSKLLPDIKRFKKSTSESVIEEIVDATFTMADSKPEPVGALIVIEQSESLEEIEKTGIRINGEVTKQLLINIFVKNTPLHDGAVLIVGNIVKAATCYLPLSKNQSISKSLGTRHRAALGLSEVSDSIIIVVSEETGRVSICIEGKITIMNDEKELKNKLLEIMNTTEEPEKQSILKTIKSWFIYEN